MPLSREIVTFHLTYLATALGRKVDQAKMDIYHQRLERNGIEDERFVAAFNRMADECQTFPTIADVLQACRGVGRQERGVPYIRDMGPLSECLADLDSGRSYGGDDQYRGRPGVKPHVERLVYEDAAVTVEALPDEGVTARAKRIAEKAESEIGRMILAAQPPAPAAATEGA